MKYFYLGGTFKLTTSWWWNIMLHCLHSDNGFDEVFVPW